MKNPLAARLVWVSVFAAAFGLVEAAVVVYLRAIYYPTGFAFPLATISWIHLGTEIARECATIVMLIALGIVAGSSRWQRFAYFLVGFAVWDLFYYVWLKAFLGWPESFADWDVLFLIPVPWIGPVLAPVGISIMLLLAGMVILRHELSGVPFRMPVSMGGLALVASGIIVYSFVSDTEATLRGALPEPYNYPLYAVGMVGYAVVLWRLWRRMPRGNGAAQKS